MTQVVTPPPAKDAAKVNGAAVPAVIEKSIADQVLSRIKVLEETRMIDIPKDYSAQNAIRAAWLIIIDTKTLDRKPVLEVCTKESVIYALQKMVIDGLNPLKKQCSFIAYGNVLTCQREYFGTMAIAKRDAGVKSVSANVILEGDEFAYEINTETTEKKITKHIQTLESLEKMVVKGAYAVVEYEDGGRKAEVMSMGQIRKAWEQGPMKGQSPAHKNFPDQMAMKTVINRSLKIDINSSDDSALLGNNESPTGDDVKASFVKHEIAENANKTEMKIEQPAAETQSENVDKSTGEVLTENKEVKDPF